MPFGLGSGSDHGVSSGYEGFDFPGDISSAQRTINPALLVPQPAQQSRLLEHQGFDFDDDMNIVEGPSDTTFHTPRTSKHDAGLSGSLDQDAAVASNIREEHEEGLQTLQRDVSKGSLDTNGY